MSCDRPISEDDLHGYVDDALAPSRRIEVERWLARNADAAERVALFQRHRAALREALAPIVAEPIPERLNLPHLADRRRRRPARFWVAAAAACVCLWLGGTGGWTLRSLRDAPPTGATAMARDAAMAFAVFGPDRNRPVEIRTSESADLVRWVSNRLQRPVSVPDLSSSGFRFMGGRLIATAAGPAGLFMYDDDKGTRIAMVMRPMADNQPKMQELRDGALTSFAWADGRFGYGVVGSTGPDRLHPLADEIRRQVRDSI